MERAISASPRGSFAAARALVETFCQVGRETGQAIGPQRLRLAQIATACLLVILCGLEVWLGDMPHALVLLAGITVLALAALRPQDAVVIETPPGPLQDRGETVHSEMILQLTAQHADDRASAPTLSTEAWGDLMARVSHDLRTPLNAVIGFSDVMGCELFGPVGDQRYREYIGHIRDSGRELLKSAEDTLAITSLLGGKRQAGGEALNLEALAGEALRAAGIDGGDIDLDDRLDVLGDRRGLRQVLVNLCSEARMRARQGSAVKLTATAEDEFVVVQLTVGSDVPVGTQGEASLHLCMARVLLELQGARLITFVRNGEWRAVTVLARAAQQDFFAPSPAAMGWKTNAHYQVGLAS